MKIAGLVKMSTIDYPGKLSCVFFTPGCNYDCWFCQNRALLFEHPTLNLNEVSTFLRKRVGLLEGVVLSGGEPTLQEDLVDFARKIKELGYAVKIDTNGSNPDVLKQLLQQEIIDYVAIDYKGPFERYTKICKHTAKGIRECIELLLNSKIMWEMRTTVIPELSTDDLTNMVKDVPELPLYALQRYIPVDNEKKEEIYTPSQLYEICETIREFQPNIVVRS